MLPTTAALRLTVVVLGNGSASFELLVTPRHGNLISAVCPPG